MKPLVLKWAETQFCCQADMRKRLNAPNFSTLFVHPRPTTISSVVDIHPLDLYFNGGYLLRKPEKARGMDPRQLTPPNFLEMYTLGPSIFFIGKFGKISLGIWSVSAVFIKDNQVPPKVPPKDNQVPPFHPASNQIISWYLVNW